MKVEQTQITEFIKDPGLFKYEAPSKIGKNRRWTEEERQYVKENWHTSTAKEIAKKLKRSVEAVRFAGVRFQLNKRPIQRWAKNEVTYLKKYHSRFTQVELAERLGRSVGSVQVKLLSLGLTCTDEIKYWNKDEVKIVKHMRKEGYPVKIIAHVLTRSVTSVQNKIGQLSI